MWKKLWDMACVCGRGGGKSMGMEPCPGEGSFLATLCPSFMANQSKHEITWITLLTKYFSDYTCSLNRFTWPNFKMIMLKSNVAF
jgi:hypothetical protein